MSRSSRRLVACRRSHRRLQPSPPAAAATTTAAAAAAARTRPPTSASPRPSIKLGAHYPLTGVAAPGLQRDPDRRPGVLRLRQRERRRLRPADRVDLPRRRLQPDQHQPGRQRAGARGRGLRDHGRPRHADAQRRPRLPQQRGRARPVRVLRLAAVGRRPGDQPVHLRLADRLRERGEDHRPVHRRGVPGRQGRAVPPGRRLRRGRRGRPPPVPARTRSSRRAVHARATRTWPRRSPRCRRPAPTSSSASTCPATPRCRS